MMSSLFLLFSFPPFLSLFSFPHPSSLFFNILFSSSFYLSRRDPYFTAQVEWNSLWSQCWNSNLWPSSCFSSRMLWRYFWNGICFSPRNVTDCSWLCVLFSGLSLRHSMYLTALSTPPEVPVFSSLFQHIHSLSRSCLFYPNTPSFISLPKENKWNLFWQDSLFKPVLVPRDYPCLLSRSSYNCHRSVSVAHVRASDSQLLFFEAFSAVLDGEQRWLQVTGTHQDTGSYLRSWISQLPELEICKEMRKVSRKFLFKFNVGKMFWLLFSSFSNIPTCIQFALTLYAWA